MSGIVIAFYLAIITGRTFFINYTAPFSLTQTLVPNGISWDVENLALPVDSPIHLHLVDKRYDVVCDQVFDAHNKNVGVIKLTINTYAVGRELWSENSRSNFCDGAMWRLSERDIKLSPAETFGIAFSSLFRFSSKVISRAIEMESDMGLHMHGGKLSYTAIHARVGGTQGTSDTVAGWQDPVRHAISDAQAFISCAETRACKHSRGNCEPIVVISDSEIFKSICSKFRPGIRYYNRTNIMHIDRSENVNETLLARGNLDTYAELYILAHAKCIVGSRSGFSAIAGSILHHAHADSRCFSYFEDCRSSEFDFWVTHGVRAE